MIRTLASVLFAALYLAGAADAQAPSSRALVIGIDGLRSDSLLASNAPNIKGLAERGAYTYAARVSKGQSTVSGPGWSSILCGVWVGKHNVANNAFKSPRYDQFPSFFTRVRAARPGAQLACIAHWAPINEKIVRDADYTQTGIPDEEVAKEAVKVLGEMNPEVVFLHFDEVDGAGHAAGFHPGNQNYLDTVARIDGYVGQVLAALSAREQAHPAERWLVVLTTDHGGTPGGSHGMFSRDELYAPFIVAGAGVTPGKLPDEETALVDLVPTVLTHLGVALDPAWQLDGTVRGIGAAEAAAATASALP